VKSVYLAGPISGCDLREANDWRSDVMRRLELANIRGISPLRCEPLVGERYGLTYEDPRFGTAKAISSKNFLDVQMCDMTLCYMPKALNERRLSVGTLIELAWAHALRKPTVLVTDYQFLMEHPVVQAAASWSLSTMDEAIDVLVGVLGDYAADRFDLKALQGLRKVSA
jgi:nucleoside 2-deoxyribosyltransferase